MRGIKGCRRSLFRGGRHASEPVRGFATAFQRPCRFPQGARNRPSPTVNESPRPRARPCVVNWTEALKIAHSDRTILKSITDAALVEVPRLMAMIREVIADSDPAKLRFAAHTLKGVCGSRRQLGFCERRETGGYETEWCDCGCKDDPRRLENEIPGVMASFSDYVARQLGNRCPFPSAVLAGWESGRGGMPSKIEGYSLDAKQIYHWPYWANTVSKSQDCHLLLTLLVQIIRVVCSLPSQDHIDRRCRSESPKGCGIAPRYLREGGRG